VLTSFLGADFHQLLPGTTIYFRGCGHHFEQICQFHVKLLVQHKQTAKHQSMAEISGIKPLTS